MLEIVLVLVKEILKTINNTIVYNTAILNSITDPTAKDARVKIMMEREDRLYSLLDPLNFIIDKLKEKHD